MIIAVGGGELQNNETWAIDEFILRSSGQLCPRVLFFPTATHDAPDYSRSISEYFHEGWGCEVRSLELTRNPSPRVVEREMEWAEVVYVGGGDTNFLMKTWNRLGMRPLFEAALARGVVLAGISAGAICWYEGGIAAYNGYKALPGLGLVPGTVLPHFKPELWSALSPWRQEHPETTLFALEDRSALIYDGVWRALGEVESAGVWRFKGEGDPFRL